jgi:hypothetical protein
LGEKGNRKNKKEVKMKWVDRACFFMICTNDTEGECLDRGLFGDQGWLFPYLQVIKKGDIGFLINISKDEIIGVFEAVEPARLNIVPEAWGGRFPAQINVKLITKEYKRIDRASFRLKSILELKEIKRDKFPYKIPKQKTYGPDVTNKVLESFRVRKGERKVFNYTPHLCSLPQGERKLKRNSRKEEREDFNKPLTLPSPAEWRGLSKGKDFRGTSHFCFLPQGERKDERKNFKRYPSPLPSPAKWRGKKGKGEILTAPLTLTLSRRWRGRKSEIFLTAPLTFVLSRKGRERMKEKILFYIGRGAFYRGVGEDEECNRVIVSLGS